MCNIYLLGSRNHLIYCFTEQYLVSQHKLYLRKHKIDYSKQNTSRWAPPGQRPTLACSVANRL